MTLASATRGIIHKLTEWWRDSEDERLDALADREYSNLRTDATRSGVTAYQLVSRARHGRPDK